MYGDLCAIVIWSCGVILWTVGEGNDFDLVMLWHFGQYEIWI